MSEKPFWRKNCLVWKNIKPPALQILFNTAWAPRARGNPLSSTPSWISNPHHFMPWAHLLPYLMRFGVSMHWALISNCRHARNFSTFFIRTIRWLIVLKVWSTQNMLLYVQVRFDEFFSVHLFLNIYLIGLIGIITVVEFKAKQATWSYTHRLTDSRMFSKIWNDFAKIILNIGYFESNYLFFQIVSGLNCVSKWICGTKLGFNYI